MSRLKVNHKKNNTRLIPLLSLVLLSLLLFIGLLMMKQNQDISTDAAGGCSTYTKVGECVASCSPLKNNKSYACKWNSIRGKCYDGPNLCRSYTAPNCNEDLLSARPKSCRIGDLVGSKYECRMSTTQKMLRCCDAGYVIKYDSSTRKYTCVHE